MKWMCQRETLKNISSQTDCNALHLHRCRVHAAPQSDIHFNILKAFLHCLPRKSVQNNQKKNKF